MYGTYYAKLPPGIPAGEGGIFPYKDVIARERSDRGNPPVQGAVLYHGTMDGYSPHPSKIKDF